MTCDWCEEPVGRHEVDQRWTLLSQEGDEGDEMFVFCCWICLMQWVSS